MNTTVKFNSALYSDITNHAKDEETAIISLKNYLDSEFTKYYTYLYDEEISSYRVYSNNKIDHFILKKLMIKACDAGVGTKNFVKTGDNLKQSVLDNISIIDINIFCDYLWVNDYVSEGSIIYASEDADSFKEHISDQFQ